MAALHRAWWKYGRALAVPLLLWGLVIASLWEPIKVWLNSSRYHDRAALREWIENARGNLPNMVGDYVRGPDPSLDVDWRQQTQLQHREKLPEYLASLAAARTNMYSDPTLLFPKIYRVDIVLDEQVRAKLLRQLCVDDRPPSDEVLRLVEAIVWDSHVPVDDSQVEEYEHPLGEHTRVKLVYQLHA